MIKTETNRPTHRVYAVKKTGGDKSFWTEIGAAWANKDGEGFNLVFNALPLQGAGIVLRKAKAKKKVAVAA